MDKKKKLAVFIIAAVVVVIVIAKIALMVRPAAVDQNTARSKGELSAKVQIVEFIDMQCPACANGSKVLSEYMLKYPKDIHVQVKYFPLIKSHSHAMESALHAECAARQGKFWPFTELMLARQPQWAPLLSAEPMFNAMAKEVGIDEAKYKVCLVSDVARQAIQDDAALGKSLGIESTPTYFINNKMVVGGKSLVDELNAYFPQG